MSIRSAATAATARGQLATARLVAMLRRLDKPLSQVAEVVSAVDTQGAEVAMLRRPEMSPPQESETVSNAGGARGAELVAAYWETVERRIASQRELAAHLRNRLQGREGSFDMYEIREVYFTDFGSAAPTDEVCDVAFPVRSA